MLFICFVILTYYGVSQNEEMMFNKGQLCLTWRKEIQNKIAFFEIDTSSYNQSSYIAIWSSSLQFLISP